MPPRGDTVQILQSTLQTAISQRGRYYKQVLSLAFRFEADDTQANRDTGNFQNILKALKLYEAVELVLSAGDPTPGWTLTDKLRTLLVTRHKIDGRVLVIIHYAGHGALNASDKLIFLANPNSPTSLSYDGSLSILENDDYTQDTDVIIILDSCYSGTAARAMDIKDRSIEIVASVGYDQQALGNSSQLARLQNKTFTSRLADEVAKQVGQGVTSVSLAELVTRLRETSHQQRKPVYRLKVGTTAIRVPNQGSTSVAPHLRLTGDQRRQMSVSQPLSGSSSTPSAQNLTALFKVHTNTDNPTGEVSNFLLYITMIKLTNSLAYSQPCRLGTQLRPCVRNRDCRSVQDRLGCLDS